MRRYTKGQLYGVFSWKIISQARKLSPALASIQAALGWEAGVGCTIAPQCQVQELHMAAHVMAETHCVWLSLPKEAV